MVSDVPVEAEGLTKRFGDVIAVEGINFSVKKGSVVGLLGGNGAGKTTTMSLLMGLVIPSAGEARIFGEDASKRSASALARINFSSPYVEMPGRLTVEENLQVTLDFLVLFMLKNVLQSLPGISILRASFIE